VTAHCVTCTPQRRQRQIQICATLTNSCHHRIINNENDAKSKLAFNHLGSSGFGHNKCEDKEELYIKNQFIK